MIYQEKIALLVLARSKNRDSWKNMKDSYLCNMTLKTLLLTYNKEYNYKFYIGIDKNYRIFDKKDQQAEIFKFNKVFPNLEFEFILYDNNEIPKGHHIKMWNILFKKAYNDKFDYFYHYRDDIVFRTNGWINDSNKMLKSKNNIEIIGQYGSY